MKSAAMIGRSGPTTSGACLARWPARPSTKKTATGTAIEPITPSGSRRKIFSSSQVSFHRPLSIGFYKN